MLTCQFTCFFPRLLCLINFFRAPDQHVKYLSLLVNPYIILYRYTCFLTQNRWQCTPPKTLPMGKTAVFLGHAWARLLCKGPKALSVVYSCVSHYPKAKWFKTTVYCFLKRDDKHGQGWRQVEVNEDEGHKMRVWRIGTVISLSTNNERIWQGLWDRQWSNK